MHISKTFLAVAAAGLISLIPLRDAVAEPNYGFARAINPQWFPDDARQWRDYDRSIMLTDLTKVEPATALAREKRQKGKWKVLPFETKGFSGNSLSIYSHTDPVPVRLALGATGWHAVYVGIGSATSGGQAGADSNGAKVKLGSAKIYRRIANNLKLVPARYAEAVQDEMNRDDGVSLWRYSDIIQEQFVAVANLKAGETIDFASLPSTQANLMYVRLVPLTDAERLAWDKDGNRKEFRTTVGTNDGHGWLWGGQRTVEELLETFEGYQRTDFAQWWFGVIGADLTGYATKVGTVVGEGVEDYSEEGNGVLYRTVMELAQKGTSPLQAARDSAREQGREFHVFIRPQGWAASMPWEETFASKFYRAHPEWRTVDREGRQAMYMSFAVPEVQRHTLAVFREAIEMTDPDGVGFSFNRGVPLMLWEKAFADRFQAEYKTDVMSVAAQDPRIFKVRAKIITEYFRSLRAMLDELGKARGGKHYSISAVTFPTKAENERYGLDIETWVKEGLVEQLGIAPQKHIRYEESPPPDVKYYRQAVAGTKVRVYPFDPFTWRSRIPVWTSAKPDDLCKLMLQYYDEGADGIGVWDPSVGSGYPPNAPYDGNSSDLHAYFGHRELLAYWAQHGVPKPNSFPLQKWGENEYSKYRPNTGY